jgi:hypothetical protein
MMVSCEINEGICRYILAWWEANRNNRNLNQRFYDMQVFRQKELFNLVKRYEGFNLMVGGSPYNTLLGNNMWT